jgi:hypothetical protein
VAEKIIKEREGATEKIRREREGGGVREEDRERDGTLDLSRSNGIHAQSVEITIRPIRTQSFTEFSCLWWVLFHLYRVQKFTVCFF